MTVNRPYLEFRDVITDDDLARLVHAMNARSTDVFHRQVCEDAEYRCLGPNWSSRILAEIWNETPLYDAEQESSSIGVEETSRPAPAIAKALRR